MSRKVQNLILFSIVFLGLFILCEFFIRFYGVDLRIFLSNLGRKVKVDTEYHNIVTAAQNAGVGQDTFNIYFLGESTMWGVPYGPYFSIPNIVNHHLGGSLRGQPVRIINLGSAAKDVVYAHYLMELLLRKTEVFHPSLIVVYSGHNQFLKFHPTEPDFHSPLVMWMARHSELARQLLILISQSRGQILEMGRRRFFDQNIFPFQPQGRQKVIDNYRKRLSEMVKLAEENEIPLLISTLVSNHASWEPNRSVFCNSTQAKMQRERFAQTFRRGLKAEKQKDYNAALQAYEEASSICDHFAEVYFRKGKAYEASQNYEKAREAFRKAIDDDGLPIRALSAQNDFIRGLDSYDQVHVVDSLAYLQSRAPNGLLDDRFIIDGIHPNLEGYLLIAEATAYQILSLFSDGQQVLKPLQVDAAKKAFNVDRTKMFEVYYETGRWLTRLATWRYDPAARLESAENLFRQAIEIHPERYEGFLGLGIVLLLKAEWAGGGGSLQTARTIDSKSVDEYLRTPWIRKILRQAALHKSNLLSESTGLL